MKKNTLNTGTPSGGFAARLIAGAVGRGFRRSAIRHLDLPELTDSAVPGMIYQQIP
jgi:hypothetical protein